MKERIFKGIGISPGIAIGKAFIMEMAKPIIWMHRIAEDEIEAEIGRFKDALEHTRKALTEIKEHIGKEMGENHAYIFDAHLLMLEDQILVDGTIEHITKKRVNAEFALQHVTNELSKTFSSFEDPYLKDRGVDVLDVANRVQAHLCRPSGTFSSAPDEPSILLAHDIHPSKLASMNTSTVLGLAMDVGGQTTHTGLLANAKNIPGVVGLKDVSVIVKQDEQVIVDGNQGLVILSPRESTLIEYQEKEELFRQREEELIATKDLESITTDGVTININANVELSEELDNAFNKYGAKGIGLYRSEYIFLANPTVMPTEDDHASLYSEMAEKAGDRIMNLRTMDVGGEKKLESFGIGSEPNPVMGLRAVRYGLRHKAIFKAQIRGALRASIHGNLRIMVPMISGLSELREVRALVEECKADLLKEGIPVNEDIKLGIMIEVPSAAIVADYLAEEADFVSVGTNDLIQYILAIDRGNETVAYLYEPFHPAVLRTLAEIAKKINHAGIPLSMCGEMAADPIATPLLIGMGFRDLSMNPISIPIVKSVVRSVSVKFCEEITEQILKMPSIDDIYAFLREKLEHHYPSLKNVKLGIPLGDL
jgi:phosphotransferase system enzyme I (PtsI)